MKNAPMVDAMLELQKEAATATSELIKVAARRDKLDDEEASDLIRVLEVSTRSLEPMTGGMVLI